MTGAVLVVMAGVGLLVGHFAAGIADMYFTARPSSVFPERPSSVLRGRWRFVLLALPRVLLALLRRCGGASRTRCGIATQVVMAATFTAVTARLELGWETIPPLVAATSLVTLAAIDLRVYRLPDAIVFPAIGVSAVTVTLVSMAISRPRAAFAALVGSLCYCAVLWIVHEINPRGLGFGDVKLALLLGLHVGWAAATFHDGWLAVAGLITQALLFSSVGGLAMGLVVAAMRRRGVNVLPDPCNDTAGPAVTPTRRDRAGSVAQQLDGDQARSAVQGLGSDRAGRAGITPTRLLSTGFPFGPALAAGTMASILFSDFLVG